MDSLIRQSHRSFFLAATIVCISCTDMPVVEIPDDVPTPPEPSWIQTNAVPLMNADPSSTDVNLEALRDIVGNVRLVGLGEGTHGTTEFWGIRQKITKFLVEEMGFTAVLMEAGLPNSIAINRYVTAGEGTALEAHQRLRVWRYQEMRDLIDWMRLHNETNAGGDTLHYYGYDCAFRFWNEATVHITEYLESVDAAAVGPITTRLENYTLEDAEYVYDFFNDRADDYIALSSEFEYQLILKIAENLAPSWQVWYNLLNGLPERDLRDSVNLENVNFLVDSLLGGAKAVIWAHNVHVGNTVLPHGNTAGDEGSGTEARMLGSRLREYWGNDYYVIATEFFGGTFLAWNRCQGEEFAFVEHRAAVPPIFSYPYLLFTERIPIYFLDLRSFGSTPEDSRWLNGPRRMRFIGSSYCNTEDREYYRTMSLPEEYDGVIFFDHTTPTTPITF